MRHEAQALFVLLLTINGAARSAPGAWFPPSPCAVDAAQIAPGPGARLLLATHYDPVLPPRDVVLQLGDDRVWRVPLADWLRWSPQSASVEAGTDSDRSVALIPGSEFAMRLDACTSELWVDANPGRSHSDDLNRPASRPITPAGYGGFLNLDFGYGGLAGRNVLDSVVDLGAFAPGGAGRSDFFVGNHVVRRLDTDWIHDEPDSAQRLRLGDAITHSADWETAVRFGGVQWGTDFSLQPDRITFPLPSIQGSAALASTAQVFVNGVQQSQLPVAPGQFRFDSVPTLTGAGTLSVVVRDSLGREQTVSQPFYSSTRLLAAGLDADTIEGGFLRENYASADDRYAHAFAATTLQHGYTDSFSALLRGSASRSRQLMGAEGDYIVSPFGVVTVSGAVSNTENGDGAVATVAFERQANDLSISLRRRLATRDYGDLGREPGTLHFSDAGRVSLNLHTAGIASLIYISEQPWTDRETAGVRLTGLAWTLQPSPTVAAYFSWLHTLGGGNSIVIGLSMSLGTGTSAAVQRTHDGDSQGDSFSIQHSPPQKLGWSYSASADDQAFGLRQAQAALTTERGSFGAGWAGFGNHGSPSVVAQTGFAWLDGNGYWTRPVQNSFAVVDAGDSADVRVYRENQLVGTTDGHGRLLVPDLLPFSVNRLSIEDNDLPAAVGLTSSEEQIAPPANAGVTVHFQVDAHPWIRLRLLDSAGSVVPAGAKLWLDGRALSLPVGLDGLVYAEVADGPHVIDARWPNGRCRMPLEVHGSQVAAKRCNLIPQ